MFKFTKTGVFVLSIIIILGLVEIFICRYSIKTEINEDIMENLEMESAPVIQNSQNVDIWQIQIPKISLNAIISEGTSKEILNQYVGHFEQTAKEQGNVGLAAHNRGYRVNYFKDLKLLKEGDEIIYTHNQFEKIYEVQRNRIIKDTEWEFLEQTEENRLTLITCIENQPEFRRCIQAIEIEEEIY